MSDLMTRVLQYQQTCREIARDLPEPYRSRALAVVETNPFKPNWTQQFESICNEYAESQST